MESIYILPALGLATYGYWNFYQEKKWKDRFEQIYDAQEYDIDYLPSIMSLPKKKYIALRGTVSDFQSKDSVFEPNIKLAQSHYYIDNEDVIDSLDDIENVKHFYGNIDTTKAENRAPVYIKDPNNDKLLIHLSEDSSNLTGVHNIKTIFDNESKSINETLSKYTPLKTQLVYSSWLEKMGLGLKKDDKVIEMGLQVNRPYIFIGQIQAYPGYPVNPLESEFKMNVRYITGDSKTQLLNKIDQNMIQCSNKAKFFILAGLFVTVSRLGYKKLKAKGYLEDLMSNFK